jgi:hypothetical protein
MAAHTFAGLFSGCGGFDLGFLNQDLNALPRGTWTLGHRSPLGKSGNVAECRDVTDPDLPIRSLRGIDVLTRA